MFIDRLIEKIKERNNPTVMGLDPKVEYVPDFIKEKNYKAYGKNLEGAAHSILDFNKKLIDAVYDIVPAVKPQLAYYEMYGIEGLKTFHETCRYAREKGMEVIADGKRNDIGSTAECYAAAFLGETSVEGNLERASHCDCLTVNPYLGSDGIKPFLEICKKYGKGIFVLVKTSNPSSGEFQDLKTENGRFLYEVMAEYVEEWGREVVGKYGYSAVGAVVGATYPEQAAVLRKIMKQAYILVPGYGAQGGKAEDVAKSFNEDGLGAIVNASRSLMCAYTSDRWKGSYSPAQFAGAARAEALRMKEDINHAIEECLR